MISLDKMSRMNNYLIGFWKIGYLNLLWIGFSLLGLVIFGVGPATYAITKYYDRWLRCKEEPPVFRTFWMYYKERFKQSLLASWTVLGILYILFVNLFNATIWYVQVANVLMLVTTVVGSTFLYSVMASLKFASLRDVFRASVMMGVGYLHYTIILWTAIFGMYYLLSRTYPSLLILFGIGFITFIIAFVNKHIVSGFEDEAEKEREK